VITAHGPNIVGQNLTRSWYLAVNRLLDSGIPEFDAQFGILCDNQSCCSRTTEPASSCAPTDSPNRPNCSSPTESSPPPTTYSNL
jgi:hypothetical protein